ncbi:MAG: beta-glucuronidase [Bacillota bacterium]
MFPKQSRSREVISLDGLWNFSPDYDLCAGRDGWNSVLPYAEVMAVPASYNDIGVSARLRDHVGDVWYQRSFFVPAGWRGKRIFLYFGSVSYQATVYLNGEKLLSNSGGFLPFEVDISGQALIAEENALVVQVNNELHWDTLPPGEVVEQISLSGAVTRLQKQQHDFFNYAGIHRSVLLCATANTFIAYIAVETDFDNTTGIIDYRAELNNADTCEFEAQLLDRNGKLCATSTGITGQLIVPEVLLWSPNSPYLYKLRCSLTTAGELLDEYELNVGVRTVKISDGKLCINGQPVYLQGCGKHEDADIRGKGFDYPTYLRDMELLKWLGVNSYRTSHYPYAEEMMELADRYGILIIDEVPAVGMLGKAVTSSDGLSAVFVEGKLDEAAWQNHAATLRKLILRDRNHPSVIMWSISNEASTMELAAEPYFRRLCDLVRSLDGRPLINVDFAMIAPGTSMAAKYVDIIGLNLYFGWYSQCGDIAGGAAQLEEFLRAWYAAENKPIIITEYGADTIEGFHKLPATMFTEEFQRDFFAQYHAIFDKLPFVIGEHVWNFADFMTNQGIIRIDGNRKGIFTRQRQPKMAAHYLRERWQSRRAKL